LVVPSPSRVDIYQGKNPGDVPVYLISEAAHFLRLPPATVRSWTLGRVYPTRAGAVPFHPVITIADPASRLLSFRNLIELHVLSSIRRGHEVKLPEVRRAIEYLQRKFRSRHPLLERQMLTDGKDLFIEQYGGLINISRDGQMVMKQIMAVYLKRIEWDRSDLPIRLYPFSRERYEQSPRMISIDPKIRFGKPCIRGTRIPTSIIAERYEAGDSISLLAGDYDRQAEEIEEAIRYESRIAS
jgi:uncharacterized protein (DUF433 family)